MSGPALITSAALRDVWAGFWPKKHRDSNSAAFDRWLAERDERQWRAGFNAARSTKENGAR